MLYFDKAPSKFVMSIDDHAHLNIILDSRIVGIIIIKHDMHIEGEDFLVTHTD